MQTLNTKKTKYEQVAEILEREGYLSDTNAFKIWGSEEGTYKSLEHVRIWKKLQTDREFFKNKKILEKTKGYRSHLIRTDDIGEGQFYKAGKEFWNEIELSPS